MKDVCPGNGTDVKLYSYLRFVTPVLNERVTVFTRISAAVAIEFFGLKCGAHLRTAPILKNYKYEKKKKNLILELLSSVFLVEHTVFIRLSAQPRISAHPEGRKS